MPPSARPVGRLAGKRVFVVEDNYFIRRWIEECLRAEGAVIASLLTRGLDVGVLDVRLNDGVTSVPMALTLAARGVPFLFYTGHSADVTEPLWSRFKGCQILAKPASAEDLVVAVVAAMAWSPRTSLRDELKRPVGKIS